jgi:DNA polymerase-1
LSTSAPLILVDGSSYLYRAFHAMPPFTNSRGEPTGAVTGVLNMLQRYEREHAGARVVVVFDAPGRTFRDDLYAQYKAHRPPMPDDLRAQVEPLLQAVQALGFPLLRISGVEADDVIGTLARRAADAGEQVLISTGDKDMAQLVDAHITLINTMSNSRLDREGVKAKFDVWPEQIIDYLALIGDSSDNIPGIDKVGPKTAAKWLAQYHTLDAIVTNAADIGGKVGENLRAGLETLALSRQLATIQLDVTLPDEHLDFTRRPVDEAALRALHAQLEIKMLLSAIEGSTAPMASASSHPPLRPSGRKRGNRRLAAR